MAVVYIANVLHRCNLTRVCDDCVFRLLHFEKSTFELCLSAQLAAGTLPLCSLFTIMDLSE